MAQGLVGRTLGEHRQTLGNLTVTQGRESHTVRPVDPTDVRTLEFGKKPVIQVIRSWARGLPRTPAPSHHTIDDSPYQVFSSPPEADVGHALDSRV